MLADEVNTLTRATELLAAHGVYALTVIFIFWQQARAVVNLGNAAPADHGYFRKIHASVVIATYALMVVSTAVWIYANFFYVQRTYIKGVVVNLADQRVVPQKAGDPPELVQQITPESPDIDIYSSVKNKDATSKDGRYDLAWILLPHESLKTLVFRFQHHYVAYANQSSAPDPSGIAPTGGVETRVISKDFKVDLSKIRYAPGATITLLYQANADDPVRRLGDLYLRQESGDLVELPWESAYTGPADLPGFSAAETVYAASPDKASVFGEKGEYDPYTARVLREQLGSGDLKTQLDARRVVVQGGKRSFRFIAESLSAPVDPTYDRNLLIHNLASATAEIEAQGIPAPPDLELTLADSLYKAGDYESAARCFDKVAGQPLGNRDRYYRRGYAYSRTGQYEKAVDSYRTYLTKITSPSAQAATYNAIGLAYRRMGRYDEAETNYRKAMQVYPNYRWSYNNLAYILAERGERLPEALSLANRAMQLDPKNSDFKDTKGWVLYKMGKPQEALPLVKEAHDVDPYNPEIQKHLVQLQVSVTQSKRP